MVFTPYKHYVIIEKTKGVIDMAIGPNTTPITFYISKELKDRVKKVVAELNKSEIGKISIGTIGTIALEQYLASLENTTKTQG